MATVFRATGVWVLRRSWMVPIVAHGRSEDAHDHELEVGEIAVVCAEGEGRALAEHQRSLDTREGPEVAVWAAGY
jgi:hypothetical protein